MRRLIVIAEYVFCGSIVVPQLSSAGDGAGHQVPWAMFHFLINPGNIIADNAEADHYYAANH